MSSRMNWRIVGVKLLHVQLSDAIKVPDCIGNRSLTIFFNVYPSDKLRSSVQALVSWIGSLRPFPRILQSCSTFAINNKDAEVETSISYRVTTSITAAYFLWA